MPCASSWSIVPVLKNIKNIFFMVLWTCPFKYGPWWIKTYYNWFRGMSCSDETNTEPNWSRSYKEESWEMKCDAFGAIFLQSLLEDSSVLRREWMGPSIVIFLFTKTTFSVWVSSAIDQIPITYHLNKYVYWKSFSWTDENENYRFISNRDNSHTFFLFISFLITI